MADLRYTMEKLERRRQLEEEFHQWYISQNTRRFTGALIEAPVCTVILYKFCNGDLDMFEWINMQFQAAYEAGRAAASPPA